MKTILALKGKPDAGRSTTIAMLFDLLKNSGCIMIRDKRKRNSKDFFVVVELGGMRVGLTSYGDVRKITKEKIDLFIQDKCIVIVCACREHGATVDVLHDYPDYRLEFVVKSHSLNNAEHKELNKKDAKKMLERIEYWIV